VTVAGHPFMLTARYACQWIGAIAMDTKNLYGIMPGLVKDDDLEDMYQISLAHPDIETRWWYAARTALGRAGGRDWWWAHNLSTRSLSAWTHINGILLRQGVDARKICFPDWLDACYSMLWVNADEEHRIKLDMELSARPRGIAVAQSPASVRQMAVQFAAP